MCLAYIGRLVRGHVTEGGAFWRVAGNALLLYACLGVSGILPLQMKQQDKDVETFQIVYADNARYIWIHHPRVLLHLVNCLKVVFGT